MLHDRRDRHQRCSCAVPRCLCKERIGIILGRQGLIGLTVLLGRLGLDSLKWSNYDLGPAWLNSVSQRRRYNPASASAEEQHQSVHGNGQTFVSVVDRGADVQVRSGTVSGDGVLRTVSFA